MSQYLAENDVKSAKNFIAAPPRAMTAGGSRPSLTEARVETAWLSRGRRYNQNEIFRENRFIDMLKNPPKTAGSDWFIHY